MFGVFVSVLLNVLSLTLLHFIHYSFPHSLIQILLIFLFLTAPCEKDTYTLTNESISQTTKIDEEVSFVFNNYYINQPSFVVQNKRLINCDYLILVFTLQTYG